MNVDMIWYYELAISVWNFQMNTQVSNITDYVLEQQGFDIMWRKAFLNRYQFWYEYLESRRNERWNQLENGEKICYNQCSIWSLWLKDFDWLEAEACIIYAMSVGRMNLGEDPMSNFMSYALKWRALDDFLRQKVHLSRDIVVFVETRTYASGMNPNLQIYPTCVPSVYLQGRSNENLFGWYATQWCVGELSGWVVCFESAFALDRFWNFVDLFAKPLPSGEKCWKFMWMLLHHIGVWCVL